MSSYTAADGTVYADEDIEQWVADDEAGIAYTGEHLGPPLDGLPPRGRPVSVGANARTFTLRLDSERRAKLDEAAHAQNTTPSEVMRELIDTYLIPA